MRITPTTLPGAHLLDIEPRGDERGFFARAFCRDELLAAGLDPTIQQINLSRSASAGTYRGLHWQEAPHAEVKIVRCTRGAVFSTIVDVRPDSPTYLQWFGTRLDADAHRAVYVPEGFANGYLTLEDDAEVMYTVSKGYAPEAERGLDVEDPALAITLPIPIVVRSDKDRSWQRLTAP
jgi:dTDP-4-dehydrorhamnose 3,5-epimerase